LLFPPGPDTELLTEILHELGEKHIRYGVKPEMFPVMGKSLIRTLDAVLPDFTDQCREAWTVTYAEISQDMVKAMVK
jgi:hemoglobin-like flavoprotein